MSTYNPQHLGSSPFNHNGPTSSSSEQEYDRLRSLARQEQSQHQHFAAEARQAYSRGDGSLAHSASEKSKQHAAQADAYNHQASEFIFRENNSVGKVAADTIDLHGQFVEEAEEILEQRIRYATQTNQTHLHVIVGKGNHSPGHVQKIKPRVEQVCRELGLRFHTEANAGRIFIELQPGGGAGGGSGGHGGGLDQGYDYDSHHQPQHQNYGQPHYQTAYPMGKPPTYGYQQGQQQMQYGGGQQGYPGQQQPQQQMGYQEPQQQQDMGIKICGIKICVVM